MFPRWSCEAWKPRLRALTCRWANAACCGAYPKRACSLVKPASVDSSRPRCSSTSRSSPAPCECRASKSHCGMCQITLKASQGSALKVAAVSVRAAFRREASFPKSKPNLGLKFESRAQGQSEDHLPPRPLPDEASDHTRDMTLYRSLSGLQRPFSGPFRICTETSSEPYHLCPPSGSARSRSSARKGEATDKVRKARKADSRPTKILKSFLWMQSSRPSSGSPNPPGNYAPLKPLKRLKR